MLPPDHPDAPKYWMYETGGKLHPALMAYLTGRPLDAEQIALIAAYLRQWIDSPVWAGGSALAGLRDAARHIRTRADIELVIHTAVEMNMDPL